jgi:hypothetical protein
VAREEAARLARQTPALLEQGTLYHSCWAGVVLGPWLARAVARTRSYLPDASFPGIGEQRYSTMFDVHHESTLFSADQDAANRPG